MTFYLTPDKAAAEAAEAEIFAAFREKIRAIDPEAVAADGTLIGRNAFNGELMPDATRTTGYFGEPQPAVQGWFHPQPEEQELQLTNPAATGVDVTEHLNRWPSSLVAPGVEPEPLPEWVQPLGAQDAYPLGMWVQHQGLNFESLLAANVWEPSPESNFWRVSPDPGPLPWRRPTGAADAYAIGDRVTHTVAGRDTDLWESNIAANTTEPGTDGTFDRWWRPLADVGGELLPWVQPVPGVESARPYEVGAKVTHSGETWVSTTVLNVWEPGVAFWDVEGAEPAAQATVATKPLTKKQQLASKRARTRRGEFVGDNPGTATNEAWADGEVPS